MTTVPALSFTFVVPGASNREAAGNSGFFGHRTPTAWLEDLARAAGVHLTVVEDDFAVEAVTVFGDEAALRFACVAFNLHAEQTPWDTTPGDQAEALERVLAGEPQTDTSSSASRQHFIDTGHYGVVTVDGYARCDACDAV